MTGSEIRALRQRLGWARRQMAEALGISRGELNSLESGHREPWPQVAGRLATINEMASESSFMLLTPVRRSTQ